MGTGSADVPKTKEARRYLSAVNLLSLKAAMNEGDNLNARRLRLPCELRLTSCTIATVRSFISFW